MTNWRKILSWQIFNDYSELKKVLDEEGYSYKELGYELIINHKGSVFLTLLTSLPDNIQFNNGGNIYLDSLISLPENIQFNNRGNVWLDSLTTLPNNKYEIFKNSGVAFYDWSGGSYKEFNPYERNASLKFSWKLSKEEIKVGDRVRVTNDSKLLSTIQLGRLRHSPFDEAQIESEEGTVIEVNPGKEISWGIAEYTGTIYVEFPDFYRRWYYFPYNKWQDFLEIIG